MKVLFALSTDKVSDLIVQRYQQKYGEMLDFKKVYFFDAILRELEKDTSYDSIIIDESLEGKFKDDDLVKRIATISTAAVKGDNTKIPLILILTPERVAGVPILYSLYNIGINNALLGTDRKFSKICELIVKPRTAKEAKDYYVIDAKDPDFEEQVVEIVPEAQVINIKRFYKNVEADKYSETFDKIANQYSDVELLYIIGKLPDEVKEVLKNTNNKYNEIIKNSSSIQTQIKEATQKKLNTNNRTDKQENSEDPFSNESMLRRQEYIQNINMNNNPQQFNQNVDNNSANNTNNASKAENVIANVLAEEEPKVEEPVQGQTQLQEKNAKVEMEKPEETKELKEQVQPTQVEEKKEETQDVQIEQEDMPRQMDLGTNEVNTNNKEESKAKEAKEETNSRNNQNNENNNANTGIESAHSNNHDNNSNNIKNNNNNNNESKPVQKPIRIDSINNERVSENIEDIGLDETNIKDVERGIAKSKKEETNEKLEASNNVIVAEDNKPKQQEKEKNLDIEEIKNIGDIIPKEVDKKIEANVGNNVSVNKNTDTNTNNINNTNKPIGNVVENNNLNNNEQSQHNNNHVNNISSNNNLIQNKPMQNMVNNQRNNMHVQQNNMNNMNNNVSRPMYNQNMNVNTNMQNIHNMNNMNNMRNMQGNNNFVGRENFDPKILEKYVNNKSAIFIGTSKSGVTFMINSLAMIFASIGINTAILDMTRNKNNYYMTTDNNEELRNIAAESINKLKHGIAEGIQLNRNLTMYTGTPFDNSCYGDEGKVLTTLYNNHTVVLIDADYSTPKEYFAYANNIYAIQTLDVLTMQPLTHFMKELKKANILSDEKIKVIINKELPVKGLNKKLMIGGLSTYNSPTMSSMEQLFNRNTVSVFSVPFDIGVYQRYLTNIVECKLDITGYPKPFIEQLKLIANDIYTLESKSKEKIVIQNEFRPEGGPNMQNGNGMNNMGNMRRY